MWCKYDFIVHIVANFPCCTVLPAAHVGVGSRFAIIMAGSCKGTRGAEKWECEDFVSHRAKSVTLITKPAKHLSPCLPTSICFSLTTYFIPGTCRHVFTSPIPPRFFLCIQRISNRPPPPTPPNLAESRSQGWSGAGHMRSSSMKVLTLHSPCVLSQGFPARIKNQVGIILSPVARPPYWILPRNAGFCRFIPGWRDYLVQGCTDLLWWCEECCHSRLELITEDCLGPRALA